MKRVSLVSVALVLGLAFSQVFAQEVEPANESQPKQGVVGRIFDDLKTSTRTVHEINKENLAAEKEAFGERHAQATEPNPDFVKFREASGFRNKMSVLAENFKESCRENSEKEKERRQQIRTHESYRTLLEEQRANREAAINRG